MHATVLQSLPPAFRPPPLSPGQVSLLLAARTGPVTRHRMTRDQLRLAEDLVRLGHLSKSAEERKRRDRQFRLTRQGHAWLRDHGLGGEPLLWEGAGDE